MEPVSPRTYFATPTSPCTRPRALARTAFLFADSMHTEMVSRMNLRAALTHATDNGEPHAQVRVPTVPEPLHSQRVAARLGPAARTGARDSKSKA